MTADTVRDVMQVCRRGHVITDVLASYPEQGALHCDRCGAPTICRCPTCGEEIPGAAPLPGMLTIGERPAPQFCPGCGAAFPWAGIAVAAPATDTLAILEPLLRRLARMVRQLRDRPPGRPTLRIDDGRDLEDLARSVLHLHFDQVRRESRTPSYAAATRTDYLVGSDQTALVVKFVGLGMRKPQLVEEVDEDIAYYRRRPGCERLLVLLYDPEQRLHDPRAFESATGRTETGLEVRCILSS